MVNRNTCTTSQNVQYYTRRKAYCPSPRVYDGDKNLLLLKCVNTVSDRSPGSGVEQWPQRDNVRKGISDSPEAGQEQLCHQNKTLSIESRNNFVFGQTRFSVQSTETHLNSDWTNVTRFDAFGLNAPSEERILRNL